MQRVAMTGLAVGLQVLFQLALQPVLFSLVHPLDLLRAVRQVTQYGPGQQNGGHADHNEQPLPALQTQDAIHAQQAAGHGPGDHHGDRLRQDKQAQDLAAMADREPLGDVVQHARKESRFGDPQQETHDIEAVRPLHKGHANGDGAPGDHDPGKPAPGAETLEHQVAGDFHQEIANEKQPGAQAIGGIANADIRAHVQLGKAHRGTIYISNQVQQDQEGNEFKRNATNKPEFLAHETVSHCFCYGTSGVASSGLSPGSALSESDYIVLLFNQQHFHNGFFKANLAVRKIISHTIRARHHVRQISSPAFCPMVRQR